MKQQFKSWQSLALVIVQFSALGILAVVAIPDGLIIRAGHGLVLLGVGIGAWAILEMRGDVNIFPDVRSGQEFISSGPYRWVRHPMYTAVLMSGLGLALESRFFVVGLIIFGILLVNMLLKIHIEEIQLSRAFPAFDEYQQTTWRLLPWVF